MSAVLSLLGSEQNFQKFTSNTTFTVPRGVYFIKMIAVGSGGMGSKSTSNVRLPGGGASTGIKFQKVQPGETISIVVGQKVSDGNGNDSTVTYDSSIICRGNGGKGSASASGAVLKGTTGMASKGVGDIKINGTRGTRNDNIYVNGGSFLSPEITTQQNVTDQEGFNASDDDYGLGGSTDRASASGRTSGPGVVIFIY